MATTKVNVILKDAEDWLEWIEVIKSAAIGLEIWEYIDPATIRELLPKLEEPVWPTPATVKQGATGISQLTADEKDTYKSLKQSYHRSVTKYDTRRTGLGEIRIRIQESLTRSTLQHTLRKNSPYDMLVALRTQYAPSDTTLIGQLKQNKGIKNHKDTNTASTPARTPTKRAMYTVGSSYSTNDSILRDSFLLDSASDTHVCNSRDRFINIRPAPADACLKGGGGNVKIEGFGTVVIKPEPVDNGDCELTLQNVAYAPMFPVSLVSYTIAMSKRFFWDGEKGILVKEGRPICKVIGRHNHWLMEYNPLLSHTTFQAHTRNEPEKYSTTQPESPEDISGSTEDTPDSTQDTSGSTEDTYDSTNDTSETTNDTADQHMQQPSTEELFKESPPENPVTVEFLSFPHMIGTPEYVESDMSDSASESEDLPQNPLPTRVIEEINESLDLSFTEPPHVLPVPNPVPDRDKNIPTTGTQTQARSAKEEKHKPQSEIASDIIGDRTHRASRRATCTHLTEIHPEIQRHRNQLVEPSSNWKKMREHPLRDIKDRIT